MKQPLALAAWLPDQSANSGGLNKATNVIPRVDGYGPAKSFVGASVTLPAEFSGGGSFIGSDGAAVMLVGTKTKLVKYTSSAWVDLATLTPASRWRFAQFGDFVLCVNGTATQVYNLTTDTASTLTGAPSGQCVAVIGEYAVIGQNANDRLAIYTSANNSHTDWNYTSPTSTATYQPMLTGGEVMGLAGGEYGVILQRQRLVRMNRTGDATAPFSYDEITPNVGCASKGSIAQAGRTVFFLSDRGFMALQDGQAVTPIGSEKVDRYFQGRMARDDYDRVHSAVDPQNKLVMWMVPGATGFMLVYHYELDRWSLIDVGFDGLFPGFTSSTTLAELSTAFPDIDTLPYTFDDPRWSGGEPKLYVIQNGVVGALTGAALEAAFEFSFNQMTPGYVTRFRTLRPITDCIKGNSLSLDCRARMGDKPNVTSVTELRTSGAMPIRTSGRYMKASWKIAGGSLWTFAQGIEFEFEQGGGR